MNVSEHNNSFHPLAIMKGNQGGQAEIWKKSVMYIYHLSHEMDQQAFFIYFFWPVFSKCLNKFMMKAPPPELSTLYLPQVYVAVLFIFFGVYVSTASIY